MKAGFELPAEKWKLMSWLENQQFDDVKKDMYTDAEREAALDLFTALLGFAHMTVLKTSALWSLLKSSL